MKKLLFGLFAVMVAGSLALSFVSEALGQPTVPSSLPKMPERLIWSTNKPGQSVYRYDLGLTQLINNNTNLKIILNPYPHTNAAFISVHKKESEVCQTTLSQVFQSTYGIKSDIQPEVQEAWPELRILMGGSRLWWGWITRPDKGIKTISGLKGHTVNYLIPGSNLKSAIGESSLLAVGLDPKKDVKHVKFDSTGDARDGLLHKKVDAVFAPLGGMEEVKATVGAEVLPFTQEVLNGLRPELKRLAVLKELPADYFAVLEKQKPVVGHPMMIVCRDDLNEQVAFLIVKTIMERARELDRMAPDFREFGVREFACPSEFFVPLHPGAIKYFKEARLWTPAHEARQKELLGSLPK